METVTYLNMADTNTTHDSEEEYEYSSMHGHGTVGAMLGYDQVPAETQESSTDDSSADLTPRSRAFAATRTPAMPAPQAYLTRVMRGGTGKEAVITSLQRPSGKFDRVIFELCYSEDSRMGHATWEL